MYGVPHNLRYLFNHIPTEFLEEQVEQPVQPPLEPVQPPLEPVQPPLEPVQPPLVPQTVGQIIEQIVPQTIEQTVPQPDENDEPRKMFSSPNDIQFVDTKCNLIYPWFTKPSLDALEQLDYKNWEVFEWGGGCSTVWFSFNCKHVDTIETDASWKNMIVDYLQKNGQGNFTIDAIYVPMSATSPHDNKEAYLNHIKTLGKKWDCIVVDGSYRMEALDISENYVNPGGLIIFDNYKCESSGYRELPNAARFEEKYEHMVYDHPGRTDWSTAFFKIPK